jgi:hypothetical protein
VPPEEGGWYDSGHGSFDDTYYYKRDSSAKSFLFTLKNPHNFPARVFPLKRDKYAVFCYDGNGPCFGSDFLDDHLDLVVSDRQCSTVNFGSSGKNNTGLAGATFFTGSRDSKIKEIEVFEII